VPPTWIYFLLAFILILILNAVIAQLVLEISLKFNICIQFKNKNKYNKLKQFNYARHILFYFYFMSRLRNEFSFTSSDNKNSIDFMYIT
jgi:hypothetical protein